MINHNVLATVKNAPVTRSWSVNKDGDPPPGLQGDVLPPLYFSLFQLGLFPVFF
jgi:hypothetical protein